MSVLPEYFSALSGFQWDSGNSDKNWLAHGVSQAEVEQAFFNRPILVVGDVRHSQVEARYYALGRTSADRHLTIVFAIRGSLIRPIMARDMSRAERKIYTEHSDAEKAP